MDQLKTKNALRSSTATTWSTSVSSDLPSTGAIINMARKSGKQVQADKICDERISCREKRADS